MTRLLAWAGLVLRFIRAVVLSGLQTVAVILKSGRPGGAPPVALVRVRFAPMNEQGAALHVDIDRGRSGRQRHHTAQQRRELLLHVLDASDTDAMVAGIRRDFEPGLRTLFGPGEDR